MAGAAGAVGFFPHDFYQPLANAWLALTDSKQLARLTDARQRHNHGYLPDHACEQGSTAVLDGTVRIAILRHRAD
jgi:hypothetical protein